MDRFRAALVAVLCLGLLAGGCQMDSRPVTIVEYRPLVKVPAEKTAPDSEVFVLWRWMPVAPVGGHASPPATRPARQFPVEVEQVYAARGSRIGFRRQYGQLLAVAGATSKSLEEAHYTWRTLPDSTDKIQNRKRRADQIASTIGGICVVAIVVVVAGLLIHEHRHTLLNDLFNSD